MQSENRRGLTLGELLVIVLVIAIALSLLIPWLLRQRENARAEQCQDNQQRLAQAVLDYEDAQGYFPGYVNPIGESANGETVAGSWVVPLLPMLGREALFEQWQHGEREPAVLPRAICPADRVRAENPGIAILSYVANCGQPGDEDTAADGVFFNHLLPSPVRTSLEYIEKHDGANHTLLLSENLQAGFWTDVEEASVGMVWFREPDPCSHVNACLTVGPRPQDIVYARPSSFHNGFVVAAYCDGRTKRMSDQIDYDVYRQLMMPGHPEAEAKDKASE